MHKYILYGLGVHSEIPLFGEGATDCPMDVMVHWSRTGYSRQTPLASHDEIDIVWPEFGHMSIRGGNRIIMRTDEDAEITHVRHLVNGIGLGLALHQRGIFALHASAVAIGGGAIAVVGAKGAGKSTLAAALSSRGHTLLSDDVVAIDLAEDVAPCVRPGPANLNLWPDSAVATGHDPSALGRIWSRSPKLAGCVASAHHEQTIPLKAILVLSRTTGEPFRLEALPLLEAFSQLVGHSYAFRWVDDRQCLPRHLSQCSRLLGQVPVFRLRRGESLESLATLVATLEDEFARPEPAGWHLSQQIRAASS